MRAEKNYPIFTAPNFRRRWVTIEEWQRWLRSHGAYGFRVAPYYTRCCVVFGERRYVETIKQLYGADMGDYAKGVRGLVTYPGTIDADSLVHCVCLPETYVEAVYWHEALHVTLMTAEHHGVDLSDQEALTYLQGYTVEEFNRARMMFLEDKKAGLLPDVGKIVTRPLHSITRCGCQKSRGVQR